METKVQEVYFWSVVPSPTAIWHLRSSKQLQLYLSREFCFPLQGILGAKQSSQPLLRKIILFIPGLKIYTEFTADSRGSKALAQSEQCHLPEMEIALACGQVVASFLMNLS